MATTTPNLGLTLPGLDDQADIAVLNQDYTLIDTFAGTTNTTLANMHNSTNFANADCNSATQTMSYRVGDARNLTHAPTDIGTTGVFLIDAFAHYILQRMYLNTGFAFRLSFNSGSTWLSWVTFK